MNPPVPNRSLDIEPGTRLYGPDMGLGIVVDLVFDGSIQVVVKWDNGPTERYTSKQLNKMGIYPISGIDATINGVPYNGSF